MLLKKLALLFAVIAATGAGAATAHAQGARTWVSSTGTDSGNTQCSVTQPCLTFEHAITETSPGGEINCLTPGSFGSASITIPVTINCEGASNGGITVGSSSTGIAISASVIVNLIGLDINGQIQSANIGVNITSPAKVYIRNCKVYGFAQWGIEFAPNASGGVLVVDNVVVANNAFGINEYVASGAANMTVRNSTIVNNDENGIYVEVNGGTHAGATIEQTTVAFNSGFGLGVQGSGAVALVGSSTLVNNNTGVVTVAGGTVYSFKNNQIGGNSTDGTPLPAYPGGPLN